MDGGARDFRDLTEATGLSGGEARRRCAGNLVAEQCCDGTGNVEAPGETAGAAGVSGIARRRASQKCGTDRLRTGVASSFAETGKQESDNSAHDRRRKTGPGSLRDVPDRRCAENILTRGQDAVVEIWVTEIAERQRIARQVASADGEHGRQTAGYLHASAAVIAGCSHDEFSGARAGSNRIAEDAVGLSGRSLLAAADVDDVCTLGQGLIDRDGECGLG